MKLLEFTIVDVLSLPIKQIYDKADLIVKQEVIRNNWKSSYSYHINKVSNDNGEVVYTIVVIGERNEGL